MTAAEAAVLPLMLLVATLSVVLGNREEFPEVGMIARSFGLLALATALVCYLALWAFRSLPVLRRLGGAILVGLALLVWVQSQLLTWNIGPLNGRPIELSGLLREAWLEGAIWVLVLGTAIVAGVRGRLPHRLPVILSALGLASLAVVAVRQPPQSPDHLAGSFKSDREAFTFHPRQNTLILLLDTFQADAMQEIIDRYPAEVAGFTGFQYFPDTVSGYPTTKFSVPLILTGNFFRNEIPYTLEQQRKAAATWIGRGPQEHGWGIVGDFGTAYARCYPGNDLAVFWDPAIRESKFLGLPRHIWQALDAGLVRSVPLWLKNAIYADGHGWLARENSEPGLPTEPHAQDFRWLQAFLRNANVSALHQGELKFVHLVGAHYPLAVDETGAPAKDQTDSRENYVRQCRGALRLVDRVFARLKELGVYDSAQILVIGDHGAHNKFPTDMRGKPEDAEVAAALIGPARPLFLYKAPGAHEPLVVRQTPMHLACVRSIITGETCALCGNNHCLESTHKPRVHYRYEWAQEYWYKGYAPPMRMFTVDGDSRDFASWKNAHLVLEPGQMRAENNYHLGDVISFGGAGDSANYLGIGWGESEPDIRWTVAQRATLRLRPVPVGDRSLRLDVAAYGYSPDGAQQPQKVEVLANGQKVAEWAVLPMQTYSAQLPKALVAAEELQIEFRVAQPTSPQSLGQSADNRALGIALKWVMLTPDE